MREQGKNTESAIIYLRTRCNSDKSRRTTACHIFKTGTNAVMAAAQVAE